MTLSWANFNSAPRIVRHFYSLDALRGLAALTVVLYHWQHFFFVHNALPSAFRVEQLPFPLLLAPFHRYGWRAVDLFFGLSGFIFFWLYGDKIRDGEVSWKEFFALRFSRLYPLHFATLLFVCVAQAIYVRQTGWYFVYKYNGLYDFIHQLFFISNWGFQRDSFNGPIWSVSVEVLLYCIFFLLCVTKQLRPRAVLTLIVVGCFLINLNQPQLGRGLISYFAGGASFWIFSVLRDRNLSRAQMLVITAGTILAWLGIVEWTSHDLTYRVYHRLFLRALTTDRHFDLIAQVASSLDDIVYGLIAFPLTLITLALWEVKRGALGKRLAFLGQISYSSYLLHFPLQLTMANCAYALWHSNACFRSPISLAVFFATLLPGSLFCFWFFELPCQSALRERLLPRKPKREPGALLLQMTPQPGQ